MLSLFSAAIPGQGGYGHINEQYQSYWIQKFLGHNYTAFDLIRHRVWGRDDCNWWYQQNLLVFVNTAAVESFQLVEEPFVPDLVHPKLYDRTRDPTNRGGREILRSIKALFLRKLRALGGS